MKREEIITIKGPLPPGLSDYWEDEVIRKEGKPPKGSYTISRELEIITKKEDSQILQPDPNLLYQSPDVEKFYPDGIRGFSFPFSLLPPMTEHERRRAELQLAIENFRRSFRCMFVFFALLSLVDLFVAGYTLAYGSKVSIFLGICYVIVSFSQFMISNDLSEEGTLFELMPCTRASDVPNIVGKVLVPIMSLVSIEIGLLIFTCIQKHLSKTELSFDALVYTVTLASKIILILIVLLWTRKLRQKFDSPNNQLLNQNA